MKRVVIILATIILSSCVLTNHIMRDSPPGKRPIPEIYSFFTGYIPGLTQLLNREYAEAAIYFGVMLGSFVLAQNSFAETDPASGNLARPGLEIPYYAFMGLSVATWAWQYSDGIGSTFVMNREYRTLHPEQVRPANLYLGMTQSQFLLWARRKPDHVNTTVGEWGTDEQWVYGNSYYYFTDGKLTAWQISK